MSAPRVVFALPEEEHKIIRKAFRHIGLESLAASSLGELLDLAAKPEVMIVVIGGFSLLEVTTTLSALRSRHEPQRLLIGVFLDYASRELYQAGASVVLPPPLTLASCYRLIDLLARRYKTSETSLLVLPEGQESPQQILKRYIEKHMGRHKIYLGAAPGVGKTYAMLSQAHELAGRGEDVVIGLVETHGRRETSILIDGLEMIPRRKIEYKGTELTEMDLDAILQREPTAVLVDELAHTNVPGSLNSKRYEDAQILRIAGISVISTVNVQHIESLNSIVERLTGVKVRETVPDWVIEEANELVLVDISPEALQQRLQEGKIYAPENINQSLSNFFTIHNLTALRELVLRELANKVDERLEEVRAIAGKEEGTTGIQDRIMACVTPTLFSQRLIRRGARLAARLDAELISVFVENVPFSQEQAEMLSKNLALAESLGSKIVRLKGRDVGMAIAQFANEHQITMILLGETRRSWLDNLIHKPIWNTILQETRNIDVVIVATHE